MTTQHKDEAAPPPTRQGELVQEEPTGGGWPALITAGLSIALVLIDGFIISVAAPNITQAFSVDIDRMGWLVGAYTLPLAVAPMIFGTAGDRFGVKRLFLLGVFILMAGSILCAISENLAQLTAARLMQGIGAAMLSPQTLVVATRALGEARRGLAIGIWGAISSLGLLLGPVIGGIVLVWLPWHWIFLINLPLGLIAFIAFALTVPGREGGSQGSVRKLPLENIGLLISASSAIVLSLGALFRGEITGLIVCATGLILFAIWLHREASAQDGAPALIGQMLLQNGVVTKAAAAAFAINASTAGTVAILTMAFARAHRDTAPAVTTGLIFLPAMLIVAGLIPFTGKLAQKISIAGSRLLAVAALLSTVSPLLIGWSIRGMTPQVGLCILVVAVQGAAGAVLISYATVSAMAAGGAQRAGAASGAISMSRNLGTAVGAAGLTAAAAAFGSPAWAFLVSGLFATLSLPFCAFHLKLASSSRPLTAT